ncbi:hypothetical protein QAD02_007888 [Eretmocerus hayati]|uniref:Uncharacterized protein n=1 Tax=Eretmocerus hayati TaxID=131215 RepID=A0ACC2N5Q7_9HYME|nr:hypothetical protein QAD02_007888 [Eretmocerus hayati]
MMRFKSKHTEIKGILSLVECNKNILKTIGIRLNLSLGRHQFEKYENVTVKNGPSSGLGNIYKYYNCSDEVKSLKHATVNETCYKLGTIIVADIHGAEVEFGQITEIYQVNSQIHFEYEAFEYVTFDRHYYAYRVFRNPNHLKVRSVSL